MARQKRTWLQSYAYVDAFSGTGRYVAETGEYLDGSPLVALQCQPPFDAFWFIDTSRRRLQRLRRNTRSLEQGRPVQYRHGDANEVLVRDVIPSVSYDKRQRAIVFLDPYGLQVQWETVRRLARARSFDVFMNLCTMGLLRLLKRHEPPPPHHAAVISTVIGDPAAVAGLYNSQVDLFGETHTRRPHVSHEVMASLYLERVRTLFSHVSQPVVMHNSKGAPLYVLFLASHNQTAIKITNDIFSRYERLREQR
jgi:three-Cys-motif partner protein